MITDELRKWISTVAWLDDDMQDSSHKNILAIADRIDKAHEEECREQYENGVNDGLDNSIDESFASADDWLTNNENEMAEHGWVRGPLDADGVPICVGDVMNKGEVTCIRDCGKGWEVVLNNLYTYDTPSLRHHKQPTVEDVLRELEGMRGNGATYEDVVARCDELAKTLRGLLAGENE